MVLVSEVRGEVRDDVVVEESARREETSGSDLGSRWERYIPKPFLKRQTHAGKQGLLP